MDSRGPPRQQGAPAESFEIHVIDKAGSNMVNWPMDPTASSLMYQQSKKVECMEDQSREYPRLFSTYEQVSFSPRATSPLSDFEHRVSPLDPNMSSTARYSPTPVQLPPSPFQNSVVVLQEPSSPLMSSSAEPNERASVNYVGQLSHTASPQNITQRDDSAAEFVTATNEEELTSSVANQLILIQEGSNELETPAAPLILSGMPGADFALTRDFLVMQDDQINVMNSFKNQSLEMADNHVAIPLQPEEDVKEEINSESTGEPEAQLEQVERAVLNEANKTSETRRAVRRSRRHINDKRTSWCDECDTSYNNKDGCTIHKVCTIADQPVPSRAVATLPGSYLFIEELPATSVIPGGSECGVFAKRNIRNRTQFGPIEGILCAYDGTPFVNALPLLYETEDGQFLKVDISNENSSNWMRFVRPALTYREQNLVICQQNEGIVFLTTRNILPKEELRAGPNLDYALRRNLTILKPGIKEGREYDNRRVARRTYIETYRYNRNKQMKILAGRNTKEKENTGQSAREWKCAVCRLVFPKAILLKLHSFVHAVDGPDGKDAADAADAACPQCGLEFPKHNELFNHVSQHGKLNLPEAKGSSSLVSYKCSMCYKRFATKVRLQQHHLVHCAEDQKPLPCNICLKRFMNNSALSCHLKTHKENKQAFECPMCREVFKQGLQLKDHVETHRNVDNTFDCPHCQRTFIKYPVIRKHIRAHHCERKHKCEFCAKPFPTLDKLRMHLLKHSDHREFHCANCGKQFKRKDKLKEHMSRMHSSQRNTRDQLLSNNPTKKFVPKVNPNDYNRFIYKCHQCLVGFKRRGMLVNHLAKRHPDVAPESVPELNLPILRQTRDYYCQYCDKVYKSSSKRKAHIMKNHPGAALPPSNRQKESDNSSLPNPTFSQTVGSVTTTPQGCQWCHKQYASKAKLLQHQRKKHPHLMEPADQVPRSRNRPPQNQNQPPTLSDKTFVLSDYIQSCDASTDFTRKQQQQQQQQRVIKISNDVELINNGMELVGQQFVRMRDIR